MRRVWEVAVSLRTTAAILALLAALLLLNVLLPQAEVDPAAHAEAVRRGGAWRFVLVVLGLGRLSTSGIFLAALAAFFANLAAVLVDRTRATARRLRATPPTRAQLDALLAGDAAIDAGSVGVDRAREVLETLGYRTAEVAPGVLWGVKHRVAVLGFPIFHAAFFVLGAGAVLLYLTRDVVTVGAAEGQWVGSGAGAVARRAPLGAPPPVQIGVDRVDVRLERGKPIDLSVAVRLGGPGGPVQMARVNEPAVWGDLTVLVERAGVAPVLWVVDQRGFTIDRVAVLTTAGGGLPTRVKLGAGSLEAVVEPIAVGAGFPERDALDSTSIALRLRAGNLDAFEGSLRPGEAVEVEGTTVRLQEVRYWAGLRLVSERGGGWLVTGFLLSVLGIVWRMAWYRREVVIACGAGVRARVAGRGEFYPARFHRELEGLRDLLVGPAVDPGQGRTA